MKLAAPSVIIPTDRERLAYGGDPIAMQMQQHHYSNARRRGSGATLIELVDSFSGEAVSDGSDFSHSYAVSLQENDYVIVGIAIDATASPATFNTSGFSTLASTTTDLGASVHYKRQGGSPDSSISIAAAAGNPNGRNVAVAGFVFRNVDTTGDAIDDSGTASNTTGLPDAPSITTTVDNAMVVLFGMLDDDVVTMSAPSGYDTGEEAANTGISSSGCSICGCFVIRESSGAGNPGAFTGSGNDAWWAWSGALTPI